MIAVTCNISIDDNIQLWIDCIYVKRCISSSWTSSANMLFYFNNSIGIIIFISFGLMILLYLIVGLLPMDSHQTSVGCSLLKYSVMWLIYKVIWRTSEKQYYMGLGYDCFSWIPYFERKNTLKSNLLSSCLLLISPLYFADFTIGMKSTQCRNNLKRMM